MSPVVELTEAHKVVLVDPNDLPAIWDQITPQIEKACKWSDGTFDVRSVGLGICSGELRLLAYMAEKEILSIAVLQVSVFPTGVRKLEVLLASGEGLRDWRAFQSQVAAYGKQHGCTKFRLIGREGLQRMLPDWKRVAVVLEREIE